MKLRPLPLVAAILLCSLTSLPAPAKKPRRDAPPTTPSKKSAPWTLPNAQDLVSKGKLPPFFNPNNLAMSPVISAPSSILIDADSGQVLWEKNADVRRPIASTTKIMTALLFVEHTKPDDIVTCTDPTVTKIIESSLHIQPGEKFTAENLLYGFMLRSGNDAAVVIAEHLAGTVPAFADMMNQRAREIGCANTHFVNPNGLTADGHYSSARDLALISRVAMRNPRFAEAVRLPSRTIERSINKDDRHIVARMSKRFHEKLLGADGVKSGNTEAAGFCYVGSATRDGHRLISVVLGARGGSSISDSVAMQSWGFRRFTPLILAKQGEAVGAAPVVGGALPTVTAVAAEDLKAVSDTVVVAPMPVTSQFLPTTPPVPAPIAAGTTVGKVVAKQGDKVIAEVPAVAARDVPVAPLRAAVDSTGDWFARHLPTPLLFAVSGAALCLVLWRTYARTTTKNPSLRRSGVATTRRRDDRGGPGTRGRGDTYTTGGPR